MNQTVGVTLEYGHERKPLVSIRLVLLTIASPILGALLGALAVHFAYKPLYTAVGYAQLSRNTPSPTSDLSELATDKDFWKSELTSSRVANAVIASPPASTVTPPARIITASEFAAHLSVKPVPQTRLIQVAYTDHDPKVATACANGAILAATRAVGNGSSLNMVVAPATPGRSNSVKMHLVGAAAGAMLGFACAIAMIFSGAFGRRRHHATP